MTTAIPEHLRPMATQAIIFFVLAKASGECRADAVKRFLGTPLCFSFGDTLTVGNVYGFATAGGYEE